MNQAQGKNGDLQADETAPGVRLLKHVWNIDTKKKPRSTAPNDVPHDIYSVPTRANDVPRRQYPPRQN